MRTVLRILAVSAATTVFRIAIQMVLPQAEQNMLQPSVFVINGTLPFIFSVYALFVYSILVAAFLIFDSGIKGSGIIRGLKYGAAFAFVWAVFMFEPLPHGVSFLLDNVLYALVDGLALLLMGLLIGLLLTDRNNGETFQDAVASITGKGTSAKTAAWVSITVVVFVLGRLLQYNVFGTYSSFEAKPAVTILWCIGAGAVSAGVTIWLCNRAEATGKYRRPLAIACLLFAVNLTFFNFFMPLVLDVSILDLLIRTGVDIAAIVLGLLIATSTVKEMKYVAIEPAEKRGRQITGRKKRLGIAVGIVLVIIGALVIFESIPYSPLKSEFQTDVDRLTRAENTMFDEGELFSDSDFANMPEAIQRFIRHSGYIGTPKMTYTRLSMKDVWFNLDGRDMTIDYTLYDFAVHPNRTALIETSFYGIPFDGYDYLVDMNAGMRGVLGKVVTVVDKTGELMDKAQLVTLLGESPLCPSIWLSDYVTLEHIDQNHVRATITYQGISVSGIFTVNEVGEVTMFSTDDRAMSLPDGGMEYVPWTGVFADYRVNDRGILFPWHIQAMWNLPEGDHVYFDGDIRSVEYGS
jgi:hypothetical protein